MKKIVKGMLFCCVLCMTAFVKNVQAATTEITPLTISRPSEIDKNKDADIGIVYSKEADTPETIYSFTIKERGWLIVDTNGNWLWPRLFKNTSLTSRVNHIRAAEFDDYHTRLFFYVDEGIYYLQDRDNSAYITYAYFIPDSVVISHNLVKEKDNSGYKDTISFTPNLGQTYLVSGIVATSEINSYSPWESASTDVNDIYTIIENGEYTVKAVFNDTEWKDFPVMYSFSVYDIGKGGKTTDDDTKTTEAKLNKTSATIKVGESFKLKVTGAKVVSYKSSKKSVAKVSSSGKVVGKKKGSATIKVTCDNGETYSCKVKVVK